MDAAELQNQFIDRGIVRGGMLFLSAPVAIDYIRAARGVGLKILGIDAFRLTEVATQPLQEHSTDYSSNSEILDTWIVAESFVRQRMVLGLYFEVVI